MVNKQACDYDFWRRGARMSSEWGIVGKNRLHSWIIEWLQCLFLCTSDWLILCVCILISDSPGYSWLSQGYSTQATNIETSSVGSSCDVVTGRSSIDSMNIVGLSNTLNRRHIEFRAWRARTVNLRQSEQFHEEEQEDAKKCYVNVDWQSRGDAFDFCDVMQ